MPKFIYLMNNVGINLKNNEFLPPNDESENQSVLDPNKFTSSFGTSKQNLATDDNYSTVPTKPQ